MDESQKIKRLQTKTLSISITDLPKFDEWFIKPIINTLYAGLDVSKRRDCPSPAEVRSQLNEAYAFVAMVLSDHLKAAIVVNDISALTVNLMPTMGYCVIELLYSDFCNNTIQRFKIKVFPKDGKDYVVRSLTMLRSVDSTGGMSVNQKTLDYLDI